MPRENPRLSCHLSSPQDRNAFYLTLSNLVQAGAGLLFWFLLARVANLTPTEVGLGYAIVALGTTIGVVAKGGLDTALVRNVPQADREDSTRLLWLGIAAGSAIAFILCLALAVVSRLGNAVPDLDPFGWALVGLVAVLLVVTWLQDAYFLGAGEARLSFHRNVILSAGRLLLLFPVIALAVNHSVALTWTLALASSAAAAAVFASRLPAHPGRVVERAEFFRSAWRNVTGSAAEFLPGLVLVPLVLAIDGPAAAGYFGIVWTAASLLFVTSAAIGRSALAEMVRAGETGWNATIRKAAWQHVWIVGPAAAVGAALAPQLLSFFGEGYAQEGATAFVILCLSVVVVCPSYLYLALLRAQERPGTLVLFPAGMILALMLLAPLLDARYGISGVAAAWFLASLPFGIYAVWNLQRQSRGVFPSRPSRWAPKVGAQTARGP